VFDNIQSKYTFLHFVIIFLTSVYNYISSLTNRIDDDVQFIKLRNKYICKFTWILLLSTKILTYWLYIKKINFWETFSFCRINLSFIGSFDYNSEFLTFYKFTSTYCIITDNYKIWIWLYNNSNFVHNLRIIFITSVRNNRD